MTVLVKRLRASELPPGVRGKFVPASLVEVSVRDVAEDEGEAEDILDLIARRHRLIEAHPDLQEPDPVGRVRALRDERD